MLADSNALLLLFNVFVCMFIVFIGIILIIIFFTIDKKIKRPFLLYFGLFTAISGLWCLTQTRFSQIISLNSPSIDTLRNFTLIIMPIPFLLFLLSAFKLKSKKFLQVLCGAHFVLFISAAISQLLFKTNSALQLNLTAILVSFTIISVLIVNLTEGYYARQRKFHSLDFGSFIMCTGALISIVFYYADFISDYAVFFRYGLIIYCILLIRFSISFFSKIIEGNTRVHLLEQMAYTDMQSGFYNFNRFEEDLKGRFSNITTLENYSVAVINLNNLQLITQIKGRKEAQDQIKSLIECIKTIFANCPNIYRTDVQEFVVICECCSDDFMQNFESVISDKNKTLSTKISAAYAMIKFDKHSDTNIEALYTRAETAMYKHKLKNKRKFSNSENNA